MEDNRLIAIFKWSLATAGTLAQQDIDGVVHKFQGAVKVFI